MPDNVIALAERYRKQLDDLDAATLKRVMEAYRAIYERLEDKIQLLVDKLDEGMTWAQVQKMQRYKDLMRQAEAELNRFTIYLETELPLAARAGLDLGVAHAGGLMRAVGVTGRFNRLPTRALETMIAFLDPGGALYDRLKFLAPSTIDSVVSILQEAIGLGYNPRKSARLLIGLQDGFGKGLVDALRTTRTTQLWSYREANRANYIANSDVVTGWIWYASLDSETCMSCIAQHGTEHGLDETLDDHYNGRCTAIPLTRWGNPVEQSGEDWFSKQSEALQRELMGPGRYEAWQDGAFQFDQLSRQEPNDIYGSMRGETTLEQLTKEGAYAGR